MNAAYAQYERDIIRERTYAGLKAARARGRQGGRPRKLTGKRAEIAVAMLNDPTNDIDDICDTFKVSRPTLYRLAAAARAAKNLEGWTQEESRAAIEEGLASGPASSLDVEAVKRRARHQWEQSSRT
jgi:DNA invertase Pin-like site-specific DNA recombinase